METKILIYFTPSANEVVTIRRFVSIEYSLYKKIRDWLFTLIFFIKLAQKSNFFSNNNNT